MIRYLSLFSGIGAFEKALDNAGYNCYWQVLNSADYGVPQGREREYSLFPSVRTWMTTLSDSLLLFRLRCAWVTS